MSYDISLSQGDYEGNITFNVGQIWRDFMPKTVIHNVDGSDTIVSEGIKQLHGLKASDALIRLEHFWANLDRAYHDEFMGKDTTCIHVDRHFQSKYDPANGWGSFIRCLMFTGKLQAECAKYPNAIVSVWS